MDHGFFHPKFENDRPKFKIHLVEHDLKYLNIIECFLFQFVLLVPKVTTKIIVSEC